MKTRALKGSEKVLLTVCGLMVLTLGNGFLWKAYSGRTKAANESIAKHEGDLAANLAAAGDLPFWEGRQGWLDAHLPAVEDAGAAQGDLLDYLRESARERGIRTADPVLAKPQSGAHYREVAVTIEAQGPDEAVFRWLAEMQSPEKFQVVKYLALEPDRGNTEPELECKVTLARWYKR